MNISVISQNGHHINEYMADMLGEAIAPLGHNVIRFYDKDYPDMADLILMTNGMGLTREALDAYSSGIPIVYFHDELKATIVPSKNVTVLSQYYDHGDGQFPVARLSLFDPRWDNKQQIMKLYNFVYWGHAKEGREELYPQLPDHENALYIGEWNESKQKAHHAPYIRNRDKLLNTIGTGRWTIIDGSDYDSKFDNIPLRVYEALMMGVVPHTTEHHFDDYDDAFEEYIHDLDGARYELTKELGGIINGQGK